MNQKREFSYFVVPANDFLLEDGVTDEQISDYYQANQSAFAVPERVKLEYLYLNAETAGSTVQVDDEILLGFYEHNQDKFGRPEQRKASHILIQVSQDADESAVAEAKARINAVADRLAQGEAFADLAKEASQDPGSAKNGGDLGFFGKGVMDPAFEAAAFSLQAGEVSQPVRSNFGFHLIKLTEIKPADVKPFDEAKGEIEREYRKAEGERLYFEMAERMADLSYEDPTSLEPVADALGLKLQLSDWVTRDQAEGVLSSPKVTGAAFSEDVLQGGNNSELIELDSESAIVLRVVEHEETSIEPMADVKDRIVQILLQQNAEEQAKAEAEKRKAELSGSDLTQVAASYPVTGPVTIGRNDRSVPFELSGAVFSSEKPGAGAATSGVIGLANGDYAVYVLTSVQEGQSEAGDAEMQARNLRNEIQRGQYSALVADLESQADIEILLKQASE